MNNTSQCSKCGRTFSNVPAPKKCTCGCKIIKRYKCTIPACLRKNAPTCPMTAVIPTKTVEHLSSMRGICNAFVHVTDINTTFYLDERSNPIVIWAGPVTVDNYDLDENPLRLRNQLLFTTDDNDNEILVFYTAQATYKIITTEE